MSPVLEKRRFCRQVTISAVVAFCSTIAILSRPFVSGATAADEVDSFGGDRNVMSPRGERLRQVEFKTDEVTWSSVDISSDQKWIVFDLLGQIYRVSTDGGKVALLTRGSGISVNVHPRISPDGNKIVFVSDRAGQDNLWIMDSDGTTPRPLLIDMNSRMAEPAWSADGAFITFTRYKQSTLGFYRATSSIWKITVSGDDARALVGDDSGVGSGSALYQWPSISPDNRFLYFSMADHEGDNRQLMRLTLEDGSLRSITSTKAFYGTCCGRPSLPDKLGEIAPEVSPDGRWLAFARKVPNGSLSYRGKVYDGRTALWLRNLETGDDRMVMDPIELDAMDEHPGWKRRALPGYSWSRDSRSIVLSQGGRLRRLFLETGAIRTIPFTAVIRRTISEQTRSNVKIDDQTLIPRAIHYPGRMKDGSLVFEAIGRIWRHDVANDSYILLTNLSPDQIQQYPAISPNGNAVAFVAYDRSNRGHVYLRELPSGHPRAVTAEPGIYTDPVWNKDGTTLYFSSWPLESDFGFASSEWLLKAYDVESDRLQTVLKTGNRAVIRPASNGRLYLAQSGGPGVSNIVSVDRDGDNPVVHFTIRGTIVSFDVSPAGNRVAIQRMRDIYVLPFFEDPGAPEQIPVVDLKNPGDAYRILRVSEYGGSFPRWVDERHISYVIGSTLYTYEMDSGNRVPLQLDLQTPRAGGNGKLAITGARLITLGDDNRVIEEGSIVIEDSRIVCVGRCDTSDADKVINAQRKTITPGWVGTHEHHLAVTEHNVIPLQRWQSAAYLSYGVTTAFDPGSSDSAFSISELIEAGRIIGARAFSSGGTLTCGWDQILYSADNNRMSDDLGEIASYMDAESHVRRQVAKGAISIKDFRQCNRVQRQYLLDAARKLGVTVTSENSDLFYILGLLMDGYTGWEHPLQYRPIYSDVSRFIAATEAHYSPDLILSDYRQGTAFEYWLSLDDLWKDEKASYWTPWEYLAMRRPFIRKPKSAYSFPIYAEGAKDIAEAGGYVTIGAHGEQHGVGSHWEVWLMAEAVGPLQALKFATYNGAHFLGLDRELGTLEPGKIADLVILNSNPLDDIKNTLDIDLVVKAGVIYDARTLDQLWPTLVPYGPRPWRNDDVFRTDVKSLRN